MNQFDEKVFAEFENDLALHFCGKRIHNLSHHFGPYNRDAHLIYFIKEGKALLENGSNKILLSAKGFFVNFPHSKTKYRCMDKVPWSIKWIEVGGAKIERYLELLGVTRENPYFSLSDYHPVEEIFDELYKRFDENSLPSKLHCISLVHKLFAVLAENKTASSAKNSYVEEAQNLIREHFSDPDLNVYGLANWVGLQHNYFSVLFKKETGESPIQALNRYRLNNAEKLLKYTNLPIQKVAEKSGFADGLYFSRVFRKHFGTSPTAFRENEEYLT